MANEKLENLKNNEKVGFVKKFINEFKEFALKGNVMDLAIGVIIGAAFGDIVTAFTDDFINPIIGCIGGAEVGGRIHLMGSQYINYGHFLTSIINFIIMAFCIFLMMKAVNKLMSFGKKEEEEAPAEPEADVALLTEIRDLLVAQNGGVKPDAAEKTEE